MGKLLPVFAVLVILGNGFHIFREADEDQAYEGLLIPSTIFIFATFLLLCEMNIYPKSLRKMGRIGQTIVEYFIASYLMENLLLDFWVPVELQILQLLEKTSMKFEEIMHKYEMACGTLCDFLANSITQLVTCTLVSLFFLLAVLQATRAIDFGMLRFGVGFFFKDIMLRLKDYFNKQVIRSVGFSKKKQVQISISAELRACGITKSHANRSDSPCRDQHELSAEDYCSSLGEIYDNDLDLKPTLSDFEMALHEDHL